MANIDRANGFRPVKTQIGAPWSGLVRMYPAADRSSDATNNHGDIYIGDPVKLVNGAVLPANSGDVVLGVVVAVGTDAAIFGEGGYFDPNNLGKRYLASNEVGVVGVVPAEGVLFEIQADGDLDLVQGSLADFNLVAATAHGSRLTGNSTVELVANSDSDVVVVEHVTSPDNDRTITHARYMVRFADTANPL